MKERTLSTYSGQMSYGSTCPPSDGGRVLFFRERAVADLEQTRLPADGEGAAADDLHARVLLRVVRRRHLDAAVEPEPADGEVDHLRPDHPQIEHVRACCGGAFDRGCRHRRRREPHVPADRDPARLELLDVGAPDRPCSGLVELRRVDAADVVCLEDLGVEHAVDANRGRKPSARPSSRMCPPGDQMTLPGS